MEGMFLQGVQLRAVTGEESSALKTKALLKVNQTFNIILSGILCEDFLPEMRIGNSEVGVRTDSYMYWLILCRKGRCGWMRS